MTAEELLKEARPEEALKELQKAVRDQPANAKPRVFLFQLLSVLGDWQRANTQLQVLSEMDSESMMLARLFEPVLLINHLPLQGFPAVIDKLPRGGTEPRTSASKCLFLGYRTP